MNKATQKLTIRKAKTEDMDTLFLLINALATYEKKEGLSLEAKERFKKHAFGNSPIFQVYLAEYKEQPVGYAITFYAYSTFKAKPILYLEDIFVLEEYRSKGFGKQLFQHCAKIALEEDCLYLKWSVLDWNTPAIDFYKKLGAEQIDEWLTYTLNGEALKDFASY